MKLNHDLGTDDEIAELVQRIKGFSFEEAGVSEMLAVARALRVLADDIITRHERAKQLEDTLKGRVQISEVVAEMSALITQQRPNKSWLPWR